MSGTYKKTIEEILKMPYPITVYRLSAEDGGGFHVFLPDFGHSACSACGDTLEEAMQILDDVKRHVVSYYLHNGIDVPAPTPHPLKELMNERKTDRDN